jgi:hypothetical protein
LFCALLGLELVLFIVDLQLVQHVREPDNCVRNSRPPVDAQDRPGGAGSLGRRRGEYRKCA